MDHQHGVPSTADSQHNTPGGGGGQHDFVDSILDSFGGGQQSHELLEMLHVPLLHGGVKEVLLFASFATTSTASFTLACFLLALCAGILEGLRLLLLADGGRSVGTRETVRLLHTNLPVNVNIVQV
ncbi:hypothetical protein OTU49_006181 [Cherax quadricarinatus]|uniref:Uncharacterized protein n=1 Tax=Cherax quadricarinatus TaxID=27406 RepID=A0AAW0X0M6_CHEQU